MIKFSPRYFVVALFAAMLFLASCSKNYYSGSGKGGRGCGCPSHKGMSGY